MAVIIEDLNLIVRVSTLEQNYAGGLEQYRRDYSHESFCCDGLITRVGSPSRSDIDLFLARLIEKGLVLRDDRGMRDIAIVSELRGMPDRCDWLEYAPRSNDVPIAFLAGSDPDRLVAVPKGWSLSNWLHGKKGRVSGTPWGQMLCLRQESDSDVYLDRRTGQEIRVRRGLDGSNSRVLN
ncbi:MAG: hypothetical protein WD273_05515 [Trueperaceae bacterium]